MTAAIRTTASLEAGVAVVLAGMVRCAPMIGKTPSMASAARQHRRLAPSMPAVVATVMLAVLRNQPIRAQSAQHRVVAIVAQRP
jgi:hypothetical protein